MRYTPHLHEHSRNGAALGDIEQVLVKQGKIRPHNFKYGPRGPMECGNRDRPYCHWLDTTPTYRILKAFKGLKLDK